MTLITVLDMPAANTSGVEASYIEYLLSRLFRIADPLPNGITRTETHSWGFNQAREFLSLIAKDAQFAAWFDAIVRERDSTLLKEIQGFATTRDAGVVAARLEELFGHPLSFPRWQNPKTKK